MLPPCLLVSLSPFSSPNSSRCAYKRLIVATRPRRSSAEGFSIVPRTLYPLPPSHTARMCCSPLSVTAAVIAVDPIERLHHYHRVAADHAHPQSHLLAARFAFRRLVEHHVQEDLLSISNQCMFPFLYRRRCHRPRHLSYCCPYIISPQRPHHLSRSIELDFDALVEVLRRHTISFLARVRAWIGFGAMSPS